MSDLTCPPDQCDHPMELLYLIDASVRYESYTLYWATMCCGKCGKTFNYYSRYGLGGSTHERDEVRLSRFNQP